MIRKTLLLLSLIGSQAVADEAEIYESVDDISIGRVFLTPGQRNLLDVERLRPRPSAEQSHHSESDKQPSSQAPSPAGYIISSRGTQSSWAEGAFSESNRKALRTMTFPGDVRIVRHGTDGATRSADDEAKDRESAE